MIIGNSISPFRYPAHYFNPRSLSSLRLWYKADMGVTLNGTTVSKWDDLSGNNSHLLQATAAKQPVFENNSIGVNYPSLRFNGGQIMSTSVSISIPEMTYFMVVSNRNPAGYTVQMYDNVAGMGLSRQVGGNWVVGNASFVISDPYDVFTTKTSTGQLDGTLEGFVNGASLGFLSDLNFGSFRKVGEGFNLYHIGNMAEIIIYNRVLSTDEVNQVNNYLQQKYKHY